MEKQIEIYRKEHAYHLKKRKDYFKNMSLSEIVYNAALSKNEKGNLFPHQYRVGKIKTELAASKLMQFEAEILAAESFEDIFKYTEEVSKMNIGVGHLWSYDTALHIGFNLGLYPTEVYLQAGVIRGLKKFYPNLKRKRKMDKTLFVGLEELEPFEIENFLCTMSKNPNYNHNDFC